LYGLSYAHKILIESTLQSNHQFDSGGIATIDRLDSFGQFGRNGLFTKHVLIIGRTGLDLFGME
jgi:hypothetical protein